MAGGGRKEATAGRRAAAAAEAACELWSVPFKLAMPVDLTSVNGRSLGGEGTLYASSRLKKLEPETLRAVSGDFSIPRLGWVSTGTGGGTGDGMEDLVDEGGEGG